jgi:hypothetical protein
VRPVRSGRGGVTTVVEKFMSSSPSAEPSGHTIVADFFDIGTSRTLPWKRRPRSTPRGAPDHPEPTTHEACGGTHRHRDNPFAGCLGVINDAAEFALWPSPHILGNTIRVLSAVVGTPKDEAEDYRDILIEMADASGGGLLSPPRTVHDCDDHEDNLVLDLAQRSVPN